jgi:hypothetical protein
MSRIHERIVCAGIAVLGVGIGIAGSAIQPWGFANAPGSLPPLVPQPGVMLSDSGDVNIGIVQQGVTHSGPPATADGMVHFIRGRSGLKRAWAACDDGVVLIEGEAATTWKPDGDGIADLVARALCHSHPLLQSHRHRSET